MLRTPLSEAPVRAAVAGAIVAALVILPGLGVGTLWDNSETAYGEVAREILLTHNWVIMHFNNVPYFVQPPLYFWLAAAFSLLHGAATPWTLRLPSALATIALSATTGYFVARQAGTRVGAYAAVVLSTCLMQAVIGRLAIMDALLDLTVALTILWWFRLLETGRARYAVFGALAAGCGFLAKGLVAPVVALLVIVPFYVWNRRCEATHAPSVRAWIAAGIAFVAVVAPWTVALVVHEHLLPLQKLIGEYTVGRYTGVVENQAGPLWYYLPVVILGFFPWIAFLPAAIADATHRLRDGAQNPAVARLVRLSVLWVVMPLLFFSFARTKLPNYIALEFPALAAITALYFGTVVHKGGTRSAAVSAAIVPVTIGALAFAIWLFTRNNRLTGEAALVEPPLLSMAVAIFAGSVLTALLVGRKRSASVAPYALAFSAIVAVDVLAVRVLPHAEAFKPVPRLAAVIQRDREPGDAVAIAGVSGGNALLFYTRPVVHVLAPPGGSDPQNDGDDPRAVICDSSRAWVVVPASRSAYDLRYGRVRHVVAVDRKAALLLFDGPACR